MANEESPAPKTGRGLTTAGALITAAWVAVMGAYAFARWPSLMAMEPNAFGDFLAGVFAPLAFLWLVLGFFQQGEELRNSGRALWLQGEELKNSVEQQRQMVETARDQLALDRDGRAEERANMRRRSQPVFRLEQGGWSGSSDQLNRYDFYLINDGPECTRVRAKSNALDVDQGWDHMTTGNRRLFWVVLSQPASFENQMLSVSYLDAAGMPGVATFGVSKDGDEFVMRAEPDPM